ncbi:MAG: Asp-tRNA(Asn)/Glu-tRNA(Gln) amidotransferase GatCAB subunit B, partial [Solirubrobacterales bacterium]|nr:Asp-tRNA(Asn)/Glu-tRNA(Gln) amidotransferase GatCAB subunit B [Solirubrobacterales bacterium]
QAREWLILLRTTLRQLGVSDVDMSQGSLRCDANVSIRPAGSAELGTKTELKNMNSFAYLERGVRAEIDRQKRLREAGEPVVQETLHYDPSTDSLTPLRSKEEAHDYRYFPEPDLVPLLATGEMLAAARADLPAELPAERAERFERELGLHADTAKLFAYRAELGDYFERALAAAGSDGNGAGQLEPTELSNWIPPLVERIGSDTDPATTNVAPESLAALATMVKAKEVSRDAAREVLTMLVEEGGDPRAIVEREGLGAITGEDDGLAELVDRAIASDPAAAEQVRSGNMKAIGPLVGYVMRETKGRADGGEITRLIRERLGAKA